MNISTFAKRYARVVFLFLAALAVYGTASYFTLPAREDPEILIREGVITTHYPGMSPERVERLITQTIEEAVRNVEEVEEIRSFSYAGVSVVHVKIHDVYFDLDQIWDEVRHELTKVEADLPAGAGSPEVNDDFGDVSVVTVALRGEDFTAAEMNDTAAYVQDRLFAVPGTKRVDVLGAQAERVFVETDDTRLAELGLDTASLMAALRGQNTIVPGGGIDTGERVFLLQPSGNFESIEAIEETLIPVPGNGTAVPLRDLAEVKRGTVDPPQRLAYFDGHPAIVFAVSMVSSQRALDYGERVLAAVQSIEETLPVGYALDRVTYQPEQVAKAVYGVTESVLQTLAFVLAVVILFLGMRTGIIVGAIVPAVMLVTLAIMGFFEMTLQRMSLATLVIALGLLVDNGIVVAEDFKRRLEDGVSRDDALRATGRELAWPLLSSTLTTILVFLPLMLADHVSSEYTRSISLVVLISLTSSWVIAMTVTPVLCHRFIRIDTDTRGSGGLSHVFDPFNRFYERVLRMTLRHRALFLLSMAALLVVGGIGMSKAPKKFFPDSDRSQLITYVDLPAGVTARTTDRVMKQLFGVVQNKARFPHIEHFAGYVGFGGPRFVLSLRPVDPAPNRGFLVFDIDDEAHVDETVSALRNAFQKEVPWVSTRVSRMFLGPSDSTKLEVQVKGADATTLLAAAERLEAVLSGVPGAVDLWNDWENRIPRILVNVDQRRARRAGTTSDDVAERLATYYSGNPVTEFREGDDIFPVMVRARDADRSDVSRVPSLHVRGRNGASIPIAQVADLSLVGDFAVIAREDLTRTVTVSVRSTQISAEDMVPIVQAELDQIEASLPPGHTIEIDGVVKESGAGQAALASNIPLCIGAMILLLVMQFNSYKRPLVIIITIPLVIIGVAIGLHVMQADFGFMVMLGIYSLAGIIINNAIVLIDRIDIERAMAEASEDDTDAIVSASVRRLRPIVMTTVTTIIGLLPLILARDALFYGMASVIAFGLMLGTILTLGVVPVLYSLFLGDDSGPPAPKAPAVTAAAALLVAIAMTLQPGTAVAQAGAEGPGGAPGPAAEPPAPHEDSAPAPSDRVGPSSDRAAPASPRTPADTAGSGSPEATPAQFDLGTYLRSGPRSLTPDMVRSALLDVDPRLAAAREALTGAGAATDASEVGLYPVLSLNADYSRIGGFDNGVIETPAGDFPIEIPRDRVQLGAQLAVPLSDIWLRARPLVEAAGASETAAEYDLHVAKQDVVLTAERLFLSYVAAKASVGIAQEDVKRAEAQARLLHTRYQLGAVRHADYLDAHARTTEAQQRLVEARGQLATAADQLQVRARLVEPDDGFAVEPPTTAAPAAERQALIDQALESRAELKALDAAITASGQARDAALADVLPKLSAIGGYTMANPNPNQIPPAQRFQGSWELGVSLTWTPNATVRAGHLRDEEAANIARLRSERRGLADGIRIEVANAWVGLRTARAAIDAAEARVEATQVAYATRLAELRSGAAVVADLLAADVALGAAQQARVAAQVAAQLAAAELERAVGAMIDAGKGP